MTKKAGEPRGTLSDLYREFTDPSASGDTPNMLRKYANGLVPGCMGLLFMGVGILVIVLFSRQISSSDKKTYLPLLFGALFGLAGFVVARLGFSTILKRARKGSAGDDGGAASK